mmetsp:Transcript_36454/g.41279  ORF Transcript_36454/g.41279 Transcript_36454/m.41279 type:complete len:88 (+) Transcript_36454:68-331(+)
MKIGRTTGTGGMRTYPGRYGRGGCCGGRNGVSPASDTMDVSSLEAVVALAISPAITSPPATDTSSSSDCDHMVCHPHQNWIGISIDE